mmetsp:Transcript_45917/g.86139  ORF Transcript_45917/g.86139 Transcript_45917/m.86139 type:complete len:347 (-) Transcript_45917:79-1119(-)
MFSDIRLLVLSLCLICLVARSAASVDVASEYFEEEEPEGIEVAEGTSLAQTYSTVVPLAKPKIFDDFGDLADDFDGNSEDVRSKTGEAKEEVYATGVEALPELLRDLEIPPKRTTAGTLALVPPLASFLRFRTFLQELLVVGLGLIGYFICRGWPLPGLRSATAERTSGGEAVGAEKMTKDTSLDTDELVQVMYTENKEQLQKLLQERSADASDEVWGCTALHVAAHCGCASAAEALLLRGACVNMTDTWDETALHFAARSGSTQVCELLIAYGAKLDAVNARDWTPLVVAAHAGHEAVCKLLLSHGAGVGGLADSELPTLLTSLLVQNMFAALAQGDSGTKLKSP